MTWTKVIDMQKDQLILDLPDTFRSKKVRVVVEDIGESWATKMQLMKLAQNDPLFLADLEEVQTDFDFTDNESL